MKIPSGIAKILAIKSNSKKSLKNRFDIVKEVAPRTLRMPISLVLCFDINKAKPISPIQAISAETIVNDITTTPNLSSEV